jgi:hypothetical protein
MNQQLLKRHHYSSNISIIQLLLKRLSGRKLLLGVFGIGILAGIGVYRFWNDIERCFKRIKQKMETRSTSRNAAVRYKYFLFPFLTIFPSANSWWMARVLSYGYSFLGNFNSSYHIYSLVSLKLHIFQPRFYNLPVSPQ